MAVVSAIRGTNIAGVVCGLDVTGARKGSCLLPVQQSDFLLSLLLLLLAPARHARFVRACRE